MTEPKDMGQAALSASAGMPNGMLRALGRMLIAFGHRLAGETVSLPPSLNAPLPPRENVPAPRTASSPAAADRFASLASMIPGVVYQRIVTPTGVIRYTYISEGAREMFGVAPADVIADPEALFRTYSEDYKANFRKRLVAASEALETWDVEASIVDADGKLRFTHAIAKPERMADGSTLWTGLILDATRIKQAEDELKAANRSVEAANRAKSMFLANMSHEIRTPMNGVLGMADLLLKTNLNPRQNRLLSTLRHSAKTLLGIINDVLDISRIESGRFELEIEPFDLPTCQEEAVDLCAGAAYQKGLELSLVVEGDLPECVVGDAGRLRQVLINLIGNAVKFTESGFATVRVSSTLDSAGDAVVCFKVIDTGIGIAAAAREALFAPFSQADSSISRKFGGTGLGLAITRHLVTLMGGHVDLHSELGRGTTVTVEIPYPVAHVQASTRAEPAPELHGQRILIADNRPIVREALASKLAGTGCEIDHAGDEYETIALLRIAAQTGQPYHFVLIDRVRPGGDNIAFSQSIEMDAAFSATRVIKIVSMTWKDGLSGEGTSAAAFALPKPVRRTDLLQALAAGQALTPAPARDISADDQSCTEPLTENQQPSLGLSILLAEDNPVNQEVALEYLAGFGCTVEVANNGEEAVVAFEPGKFDIILMDCQMPVLDGLSAVRQIRLIEQAASAPRIAIVAVTANAYESDRQDAVAAGMDDYLVKPFSDEALLQVLQKWTARPPIAKSGDTLAEVAVEHAA